MPGNLRPTEILIILLVIVVIFGAAKLPNIAANLGKSMKVFKKEVKELREDDNDKPADPYEATGGVRVDPQQYTPPQQQQYPQQGQQYPQQPQQGPGVTPPGGYPPNGVDPQPGATPPNQQQRRDVDPNAPLT
ncbi:Sec-independent protein translocase subunit TatA [Bowdeniella massiliensis]|uniref:Sec-independent protein translocase subunit TatA n=1 Tax=Bowdeniella massiliensis TaxID=2932264 RepID=UPI0020284443|nr:Sec-independent protein translocase subunit TatA [Bowdeniella massiliensis]